VLYDRVADPAETANLAASPSHRDVVARYNDKLEALITAEIGDDRRVWVSERPQLLGIPRWRGDSVATVS
jgi:hypothetical protein